MQHTYPNNNKSNSSAAIKLNVQRATGGIS